MVYLISTISWPCDLTAKAKRAVAGATVNGGNGNGNGNGNGTEMEKGRQNYKLQVVGVKFFVVCLARTVIVT